MKFQNKLDKFVEKNSQEPKYADVSVVWKDTGVKVDGCIIKLDAEYEDGPDIFFNVNGVSELDTLCQKENGEDFYIIESSVSFLLDK